MVDDIMDAEFEVIENIEKEKEPETDLIIIAPHPDDEIIGAYKYLTKENAFPIIIYSADLDAKRKESTLKLKEHVECKVQLFQMTVPQPFLQPGNKFLFPDPIYELHPHHRAWGFMGEQMARNGFDVTFYSTNMNSPHIHEVAKPNEKRELLEKVYPDQKSLWEFDHKYFLFEGYYKWMF